MVIGKLNAKNLFENNAEEKVDSYKSSIQVGKINAKDIFTEANNDAKPLSRIDIKVGKLKIKEEDLFEATKEAELPEKSNLKVGKLTAPDLFTSPTEELSEPAKFYKPVVQPKKLKVAELFTPTAQEPEPG